MSGGAGMSLVCIESMAAGNTIIAWDNLIYQQLLTNGYSGYLVPDSDIKALGEGLAFLLENEDFARTLGKNAQKEAKKFDWSDISKQFSDYLNDLF